MCDPQQRLLHTLTSALNIWMSPGIMLVSLSMSYARGNHERPEQDLEVTGHRSTCCAPLTSVLQSVLKLNIPLFCK
jgi:hypothetical protein